MSVTKKSSNLMTSVIGNKLASLYELLRDRKKVGKSILFQKVCLSWRLSIIINWRRVDWNKNVLGGKKSEKN